MHIVDVSAPSLYARQWIAAIAVETKATNVLSSLFRKLPVYLYTSQPPGEAPQP